MSLPLSLRSQGPLLSRKGASRQVCVIGPGTGMVCTFVLNHFGVPTTMFLPAPHRLPPAPSSICLCPVPLSPGSPSLLPPSQTLSDRLPLAPCLFQAISCSLSLTFCLRTIPIPTQEPLLWLVSSFPLTPSLSCLVSETLDPTPLMCVCSRVLSLSSFCLCL